jgi:hypothetical protein
LRIHSWFPLAACNFKPVTSRQCIALPAPAWSKAAG